MKRQFILLASTIFCFTLQVVAQPEKVIKSNTVTLATLPAQQNIPVRNVPQSYNFNNVKMCIDRVMPAQNMPERKFTNVASLPKINADGSTAAVGVSRQPLAGETSKMWDPGQTVTVFISNTNSTDRIRGKVRQYASEWSKHANINFQFVNDFNAGQVKVEFSDDNKSWSWMGKDVLFNPLGLYTMHYGWLTDQTDEAEYRRVIEHEFGHALGFIHEHQSPVAGINWDKEKVYSFFALPPNNWSRADVDRNIFEKYSKTSTNFSAYDPTSIMHYAFAAELTTDGVTAPMNTDFSATDKSYARQLYPFPPTISNATGTLRTGDDCDMIDFTVEYYQANVPSDKVEFVLSGGQYNNKTVTWWKQIGIPLTNGQERSVAFENGSTGVAQIALNELKANTGISFWKGKLLGVHTQLGYRWNILPALPGGCRVRLIWKNDACN